jgi:hypothetical protein
MQNTSSAITVEIMGGLGNQLFQIFAAIAYSLKHKLPFYFPEQQIKHGERKKTYWDTPFLKSLKPFVKQEVAGFIYHEPNFHYQCIPLPPSQPHHLKLFGYYQSYKYFEDYQDSIYKYIRLRENQDVIREKSQDGIREKSQYNNTLAMHFRVGDYKNLPNHHPLMKLEYYTNALRRFLKDNEKEIQTKINILYFCEEADEEYVKTNMVIPLEENEEFKNKFTFTCIDHSLSDWEQILTMSLCQYHIIANSTFSWWGAYLSNGGDKSRNVYYPAIWFGVAMGNKKLSDLFPANWCRI